MLSLTNLLPPLKGPVYAATAPHAYPNLLPSPAERKTKNHPREEMIESIGLLTFLQDTKESFILVRLS